MLFHHFQCSPNFKQHLVNVMCLLGCIITENCRMQRDKIRWLWQTMYKLCRCLSSKEMVVLHYQITGKRAEVNFKVTSCYYQIISAGLWCVVTLMLSVFTIIRYNAASNRTCQRGVAAVRENLRYISKIYTAWLFWPSTTIYLFDTIFFKQDIIWIDAYLTFKPLSEPIVD